MRCSSLHCPDRYELLIVDDGSSDGTGDILRKGGWPDHVRVLAHDRNRGKGAAIRTGLAAARGAYTTIMDADLEYSPADIPALARAAPARRCAGRVRHQGFQVAFRLQLLVRRRQPGSDLLCERRLQQLDLGSS